MTFSSQAAQALHQNIQKYIENPTAENLQLVDQQLQLGNFSGKNPKALDINEWRAFIRGVVEASQHSRDLTNLITTTNALSTLLENHANADVALTLLALFRGRNVIIKENSKNIHKAILAYLNNQNRENFEHLHQLCKQNLAAQTAFALIENEMTSPPNRDNNMVLMAVRGEFDENRSKKFIDQCSGYLSLLTDSNNELLSTELKNRLRLIIGQYDTPEVMDELLRLASNPDILDEETNLTALIFTVLLDFISNPNSESLLTLSHSLRVNERKFLVEYTDHEFYTHLQLAFRQIRERYLDNPKQAEKIALALLNRFLANLRPAELVEFFFHSDLHHISLLVDVLQMNSEAVIVRFMSALNQFAIDYPDLACRSNSFFLFQLSNSAALESITNALRNLDRYLFESTYRAFFNCTAVDTSTLIKIDSMRPTTPSRCYKNPDETSPLISLEISDYKLQFDMSTQLRDGVSLEVLNQKLASVNLQIIGEGALHIGYVDEKPITESNIETILALLVTVGVISEAFKQQIIAGERNAMPSRIQPLTQTQLNLMQFSSATDAPSSLNPPTPNDTSPSCEKPQFN